MKNTTSIKLEPGDEEVLEKCPVCNRGYMVPTYGNWYECSECATEAEEKDGLLWYEHDFNN